MVADIAKAGEQRLELTGCVSSRRGAISTRLISTLAATKTTVQVA